MFHIVLVEPEIPSNTGNIARLCAATRSVLHLVHPLGFKLDDRAMKRSGMDYLEMTTIQEHASLEECLAAADRVYYFSTKGQKAHWSASFKAGDYLVFGRETKGLPEALLETLLDETLTIPMLEPEARSLNLSTAVGIGLYEAIRQTASNSTAQGERAI